MRLRGFTLLEVLMSLVLLASLVVLSVTWTSRVLAIQEQRSADTAARALERRVRMALRVDFASDDLRLEAMAGGDQRIRISENALHVLCRDNGLAQVEYRADAAGVLTRIVRPIGSGAERVEVLGDGVWELVWEFVQPHAQSGGVIRADWVDDRGLACGFTLEVDRGWLP